MTFTANTKKRQQRDRIAVIATVVLIAVVLTTGCASPFKKTKLVEIPVSPPRERVVFDVASAVSPAPAIETPDEDALDRDLAEKKSLLKNLDTDGDELTEALRKDALLLISRLEEKKKTSASLGRQLVDERKRSDEIERLLKSAQSAIDQYEKKAGADSRLVRSLQRNYNEAVRLADAEARDTRTVSVVSTVVSLIVGIVITLAVS